MSRSSLFTLASCALCLAAGCGGGDGAPPPSCATYLWEPGAGDLSTWPTAEALAEDPTTDTGYRLALTAETFPELATFLGYATVATEDMVRLDGFGVLAGGFVAFDDAFDSARLPAAPLDGVPEPSAGIGYVVLPDGADPYLVAAELALSDAGRVIVLEPLFPLPEQTRFGIYVSRDLEPAAVSGCLESSAGMAALLASPDADRADAITALVALGAIASAEELVALHVVPTQTITRDSVAVADAIDAQPAEDFALSNVACVTEATYRACTAELTGGDFRGADGVVVSALEGPVAASSTYTLVVHFWLPLESTALPPYPTILYGHGLSGSAAEASLIAPEAAPRGYAVAAVSAVQHGDHPTVTNPVRSQTEILLDFFAIDFANLATDAVDALALRDNFRQSTYDRLQVIRMLETAPDLTGDGMPEVDPNRLVYLGISLGGIMGSELVSLTDAFGAAALLVPGGRVTTMIHDPDTTFSDFLALVAPGFTPTQLDRFFPMLQLVLDAGDSASYARHLLRDRLRDTATPSVLVEVALGDDVVPNSASWILARSMGIDIVPDRLLDVPGLATLPGTPVSGNVLPGVQTAGLVQFDVVQDGADVVAASHEGVPGSPVGVAVWSHFLETHLEDGLAEIVDGYTATGLAHELPALP